MVDVHNLPNGDKLYFCDGCEKDFGTKEEALEHEKTCSKGIALAKEEEKKSKLKRKKKKQQKEEKQKSKDKKKKEEDKEKKYTSFSINNITLNIDISSSIDIESEKKRIEEKIKYVWYAGQPFHSNIYKGRNRVKGRYDYE